MGRAAACLASLLLAATALGAAWWWRGQRPVSAPVPALRSLPEAPRVPPAPAPRVGAPAVVEPPPRPARRVLAPSLGTASPAPAPVAVATAGKTGWDERAWQSLMGQVMAPSAPMEADDRARLRAAIAPMSETERRINRRAAWAAVRGNPLQVAREGHPAPVFQDGRITGIVLQDVPAEGLLAFSGFASGDVVRTVNGKSVAHPGALLEAVWQTLHQDDVEVRLERHGQPHTLRYYLQ